MAIAVTGASGGVGSRVVRHLLAREGLPLVVALARRPREVPRAARLTVRRADYDDPSTLRRALAGVDTLVFVSSDGVAESMRRHHEHVVNAARDSGVRHVVYTSILDVAADSRFYYASVHRETEALLGASGLAHCLGRASIFADYFVSTWTKPALEQGTLALPAGTGRMSLVARDDVARALAVAAVSRREGVIELTGPAALTVDEISEVTAAATGRPLRYLALGATAYRRRLAEEGDPEWLIDAYSSMFTSVREGRFATVSEDIPRLVSRPQQPYAAFMRAHAGHTQGSR